jgi:hypothetical protein
VVNGLSRTNSFEDEPYRWHVCSKNAGGGEDIEVPVEHDLIYHPRAKSFERAKPELRSTKHFFPNLQSPRDAIFCRIAMKLHLVHFEKIRRNVNWCIEGCILQRNFDMTASPSFSTDYASPLEIKSATKD